LGLSGFLGLGWLFPSHFREVFNDYLLKYFLMAFLFVFFFWDSYDSNVGVFNIVPEVFEVVLISFNSFFFLPLWISLTVENLFTINLDVLSSVLYGWRSLEATARIRLKARGRRLKSKT